LIWTIFILDERVGISYQSEKNYTQYRWKKQDDQSLAKAAEEKSIQDRIKIEPMT
jgi:hypothetical protein